MVLLDYNLPDMTGWTLLERILRVRDLPVIFVTGENAAATAAEAIRRGAQDYVVKLGDYLFALPVVVEKNIRQHRLKRENARLQAQLQAMPGGNPRQEPPAGGVAQASCKTMAATDHLTGLANRRAFAEMLDRCYGEAVAVRLRPDLRHVRPGPLQGPQRHAWATRSATRSW